MQMHNPPHPGKILQEYLGETDVTSFSERIGVSRTTLSRLLHGHAGISAPMALRLSAELKTTAVLWMNLQVQYDLWHAMEAQKKERGVKKTRVKKSVAQNGRRERVSGVRSAAA